MTSQRLPEERVEGIRRAPRREAYENLPLSLIRDSRISYRALGVLTRLLSNADNFRMSSTALAHERKEGREAVRAALRELEAAGYIMREKLQNSRGQWSTVMVVSETPQPSSATGGGSRSADFRASVSRSPDNRSPVSRALESSTTNDHYQETTTTDVTSLVPPRSLSDEDGRSATAMVSDSVRDALLAQQLLDELDAANSAGRIKGAWPNYLHGLISRAAAGSFIPAAGKSVAERRRPQPSLREKIGLPPPERVASKETADAAIDAARKTLGLRVGGAA